MNRREFLAAVGAVSAIGPDVLTANHPPPSAKITFGYASITWQGNDRLAIEAYSTPGSSDPKTSWKYDHLGRVTLETRPDGTTTLPGGRATGRDRTRGGGRSRPR